MLASLRLDALVCRDDQQDEINSADSGEHVAHEALVAGNVDEAEAQALAVIDREFKVREAQINRYSATFFFLQPVGVDAGQCLDQRGFAVINVAGGTDDDGFHF